MKQARSPNELVLDILQDTILQLETLVEGEYDKSEAFRVLAGNFIAQFIASLLHASLTSLDGVTLPDKERLEFTEQSFLDMKTVLQHSVSLGFTKAVSVFSGHLVHYMCKIEAMGESINEEAF